MHATPSELADRLTAADLALYQAWAEEDGPWWGEREAAYLRTLCSVTAAAAGGADVAPDDFRLTWSAGPAEPVELLDAEAGLRVFAAKHGLAVTEETR